jgi:predicted RNA methylase
MEKIKLKHLVEYLEDIETFENPKEELEQYQTTPQIAAEMLHYINQNTPDFGLCNVVDLGCGTGILGIAAALSGAGTVTLVDIDADALEIAKRNIEHFELTNVDIVNTDVNGLSDRFDKKFEVVITNPPFGIRSEKAADVNFLKKGLRVNI